MAKIRTLEEAKAFRKKIENAAKHLPEEEALNSLELFPKWDPNKDYPANTVVRHGDKLYNCVKDILANPTWTPDVVAAHWSAIARPGENGTFDAPIEAVAGMTYEKDKFYKEGESIYLCTRDDSNGAGTILHFLPSALVGHYFDKVN